MRHQRVPCCSGTTAASWRRADKVRARPAQSGTHSVIPVGEDAGAGSRCARRAESGGVAVRLPLWFFLFFSSSVFSHLPGRLSRYAPAEAYGKWGGRCCDGSPVDSTRTPFGLSAAGCQADARDVIYLSIYLAVYLSVCPVDTFRLYYAVETIHLPSRQGPPRRARVPYSEYTGAVTASRGRVRRVPRRLLAVLEADLNPSANLGSATCSARFCHSPRLGRTSFRRIYTVRQP